MAQDPMFPDEKLGWKPHPDARSVLEEFRQVTLGRAVGIVPPSSRQPAPQ